MKTINARTQIARSNSHGNAVNIVSWFLLVFSVLATLARLLTKRALNRDLSYDDTFLLVALIFSIAQAITVSLQVANGLGQHVDSLEGAETIRCLKSSYASDVCFITTLWISKISVLLLTRALTPVKTERGAALIAGGLIIAYGATGTFVVAFQCTLPRVWDTMGNMCINRNAFQIYFGVANIISELILMLLPAKIIWGLQLDLKRKVTVLVCFMSRLLVVVAIICQLSYQSHNVTSLDPAFTLWKAVLSANVVQNTSIITACIPCLKPFLESLETGMIGSDAIRRRQGRHRNSYKLSNASNERPPTHLSTNRENIVDGLGTKTTACATNESSRIDDGTAMRQATSPPTIKTTRTWTVDVEESLGGQSREHEARCGHV